MIKEHQAVVLTIDLPEYGLRRGDVGTAVMVHADGKGYEVEFMTLGGSTLAVVTLDAGQLRPVADREIAHARELA